MESIPPTPRSGFIQDPWVNAEPELSATLLAPMLRFYEGRFGRQALHDLARTLGTRLEVLEDSDRWFSAQNFLEFNRKVVERTNNPNITYEAGLEVVETGIRGIEGVFLRALLKPRLVYESVPVISGRYSRITDWSIELIEDARAVITFTPQSAEQDDLLFCRNRHGVLEGAPRVFGLPRAQVDHPVCLYAGGARCEYHVRWSNHGRLVRPAIFFTVASGLLTLYCVVTGSAYTSLVSSSCVALVIATLVVLLVNSSRAVRTILQSSETRAELMQSSMDENRLKVERLILLQSLNEAAASHLDEDDLLDGFLDRLARNSSWDRVVVMMVDEDAATLGQTRSRGFGEHSSRIDAQVFQLMPRAGEDRRLFANIVASGETVLIDDLESYAKTLTPRSRALIHEFGSGSMLVAPIEASGRVLGLLVVDRISSVRPLNVRDKDLLRSVGAALGTALSNARLYGEVRQELLKNRKYSQFLPSPVVAQIQDDPGAALRLGGDRRQVALMFCDIAGFTALSAALPPEDVVRGLNAWFGLADPAIEACNGIIDKRMGDGILIVFLPEADSGPGRHPVERAAAAAVEMYMSLERSRADMRAVAPGFASIQVRWAIHYGEVIAGNLGSRARIEYTVIGDAVNTCARLEEITPAGEAWLTGDAVLAVDGGLSGASYQQTARLRGLGRDMDVYSIPLDAESSASGTWRVAPDPGSIPVSLAQIDLESVVSDPFLPSKRK